ncbi:mCG145259, partial [Mus musculus]
LARKPQGSSWVCLPSAECRPEPPQLAFYVACGRLKSGPRVFPVSIECDCRSEVQLGRESGVQSSLSLTDSSTFSLWPSLEVRGHCEVVLSQPLLF